MRFRNKKSGNALPASQKRERRQAFCNAKHAGHAKAFLATFLMVSLFASYASAEAIPRGGPNDHRVRVASYQEGQVYRLNVSLTHVTTIEFGTGESIRSIIAGDTEGFEIDGVPGGRAFAIKPVARGVHTNVTVYTNRRSYYFNVNEVSSPTFYVVQFRYPEDNRRPSNAIARAAPNTNYAASARRHLHLFRLPAERTRPGDLPVHERARAHGEHRPGRRRCDPCLGRGAPMGAASGRGRGLYRGDAARGGRLMSDNNPDLEQRLAALEQGNPRLGPAPKRRSPLLALLLAGLILAGGLVLLLFSGPGEEVALPTATPDEFQTEGDGFGEIELFVPPPAPEPEIVLVEPEPNAELLAQIAALQAQIEELRDAPDSDAGADSAAAEAIDALTARIADLQDASENAQEQFQAELAARDRELQQLRMDLDLARLEANKPTPAPLGPTDEELRAREEERLRREEEARRLAELQRRAEEERAFQERRISSPVIAFGGTGGANAGETELTERTFGEVTDFVLNGALPSAITQAEVIANPSNTVIQGTMIQAVMETALDSSLPGQTRAIISEDVFSYDGSRLLIPRGSRLIGRFRSGIEIAQRRVTIAWDRIILPNNQTVQISSFGGDELGRSGVTGFVDTRFDERFGSAALISIISAAPSVAAAQVEDETTADVLEDVGDDLANATDSVIGEYLSIGPVIYVDQGARVTVMVDRDLEIF